MFSFLLLRGKASEKLSNIQLVPPWAHGGPRFARTVMLEEKANSVLLGFSFQGPGERKQVARTGSSAAGAPSSRQYPKMEATNPRRKKSTALSTAETALIEDLSYTHVPSCPWTALSLAISWLPRVTATVGVRSLTGAASTALQTRLPKLPPAAETEPPLPQRGGRRRERIAALGLNSHKGAQPRAASPALDTKPPPSPPRFSARPPCPRRAGPRAYQAAHTLHHGGGSLAARQKGGWRPRPRARASGTPLLSPLSHRAKLRNLRASSALCRCRPGPALI